MKEEFAAEALTIYVGSEDKWQSGLLYPAIVERLKAAGIAGVTVLHGIEGYGVHARVHTERIEVLFSGLPIVIEAVDTPERIQAVLPQMDELVTEGLITVHEVRAFRYRKTSARNP